MGKVSAPDSPPNSTQGSGRVASSLAVIHAGVTYQVAVKRVGTARRFTLRVRTATQDAVLTMPSRGSMRTARNFAERHAEWIGTRLSSLPRRQSLAPDMTLPFRGVDHRVVHDPAHRSLRRVNAEAAPDEGADAVPVLRVSGRREDVGRHLLDFLRREAQRDLAASVERYTKAIGKPCRRIAIRDTRSRWGSCSSKGNLNFSWRLILAPPFVLDYLAAHECAHLRHMNHSPAFWELTERLAPHVHTAEAWLKAKGSTLHLYGV